MSTTIGYRTLQSPLGEMLLVAEGDALCGVYFSGQKYFPTLRDGGRADATRAILVDSGRQLAEYFDGTRKVFDMPLAPAGTSFQRAIWRQIAAVPWGATTTYSTLAARVGRPNAVRAAGAATGRNPLSLIVPCHRIVGADGGLTGYAGGLDRKRALHALERIDTRFAA